MSTAQILVIAAAGLGPFVQSLAAIAAIRTHHRDARLALITAPETIAFASASPYVDDAWSEPLPAWWQFRARKDLGERLRAKGFSHVYDLDGGAFGDALTDLLRAPGTIAWSRAAPTSAMHVHDRLAAQLKAAGVNELVPHDLTWVARRVTGFHLPMKMTDPFALIATDPSPSGATWPLDHQTALADAFLAQGLVPVLVGLTPAPELATALTARCPRVVDLSGRAAIEELVFLGWAARAAVGPDNGLMHIFAMAGCRAVVLYDSGSDPALTGQRGSDVLILRRARLEDIPAGEVVAALKQRR